MAGEVRWIVIFFIFSFHYFNTDANQQHRKFEYKYSFKPPYLAQKDGSVPFWTYGGHAIASSENVRVAPSLRSRKGAIWSKNTVNFDWWEVEIMFRVTGRGRIGADGLAFWYTTSQGDYDGDVFGSSDMWNGLGVFFDSFDNDGKHNNPYIMAVLNDGTKQFDHPHDGVNQLLAGCLRDFRNKPFPTRAKIEYNSNTLKLLFHNGMTNSADDYELCFHVDNVILPKNGYFGVSAATGGMADDHDVISFLTTSIHDTRPEQRVIDQAEKERIAHEYNEQQKKLADQKEQYRKDHPEAQQLDEFEEFYESDTQREYRNLITGQNQIHQALREVSHKADAIVGKEDRIISLMSQIANGIQVGGGLQVGGQQGGQPLQLIDTIRRQEVEAVLSNQNIILNTAKEIKTFIGDINSKAESILNNQVRAPTAQIKPVGYDYQALINEMRDGLNQLKRDIAQINSDPNTANVPGGCPTTNCLTLTMFLVFLVIQMFIIIGYNLYKDNKSAQAKKFF